MVGLSWRTAMRILYIEDDDILAQYVQIGLKPTGFAVDRVTNAEDGRLALSAVAYDAVLLDLNLPDADGITLLKKLRAERNTTPILILSSRRRTDERITGLHAGADDYLPKPFEVGELAARLHAVTRRSRRFSSDLACGNLTFMPEDQTASVMGQPLRLRRREAAVLGCLLRNSGRAVSKPAIEEQLYAFGEEVASNSVEVHVHNLRKQLAGAGATVRIETRRGIGYILVEVPADQESGRLGSQSP
jgi:DNA-binding response OmpR family regulator